MILKYKVIVHYSGKDSFSVFKKALVLNYTQVICICCLALIPKQKREASICVMLRNSSQAKCAGVLFKLCLIAWVQMAFRFCSSIQLWVPNPILP